MTTEVLCTLVTAGGTLLSACIAFFVSRSTANKEIEKMKLTWEREDIISSDDEFAEMASAVAKFVLYNSGAHHNEALARVASVRAKEMGNLANILDTLYQHIRRDKQTEANDALTAAINERRSIKKSGAQ